VDDLTLIYALRSVPMARAVKELVRTLSQPGTTEVLHGDLALVGLPGVVFTPSSGRELPAVVLGHDWMQPVLRYRGLLRHLASWGIVALGPDTERSPLPSTASLAADLRTALDIAVGVRLGGPGSFGGEISVDPYRLGLIGHGTGGGAAVVAAAQDDRVRGLVLLAPSDTRPSAIDAARLVFAPALVLVAGKDKVAPPAGHAEPIASALGGKTEVRTLPKASHLGFVEGTHWTDVLVEGRPQRRTQRLTRALTTAFLLRELTGSTDYDELLGTSFKGAMLQPA
jgi:dienelactone hydrolase